jgi:RNA polymerase sigma factor (sigma-70 family)
MSRDLSDDTLAELTKAVGGMVRARGVTAPADTDDLTSEAVMRVLKWARREGIDEMPRLRGYAQQVVRGLVADHWRARQRQGGAQPLQDQEYCLPEELEDEVFWHLAMAIRQTLLSARQPQRVAMEFILSWLNKPDEAIRQTAQALDLTENCVRVCLTRFRALLQKQMSGDTSYPTTVVRAIDVESRWREAGHPPVNVLGDYIGGGLPRVEQVAVTLHLIKCTHCFAYVSSRRN